MNSSDNPAAVAAANRADGISKGCRLNDNADTAWSKADKSWFRKHPDRSHRIRKPFNGELEATRLNPLITHIVVRQILPGLRHRLGFGLVQASEYLLLQLDDEYMAHVVFDDLLSMRAAMPGACQVFSFDTALEKAETLRAAMGAVQ